MGRVLPILFSTEMVRAILDGRKNVTRRTMNPQPLFYTGRKYIFDDDKCPKKWECCDNILETYKYQPGDILYVREAYCPNYFDKSIARYRSGGMKGNTNAYRADYRKEIIGDVVAEPKWKPSIHMPKKAARIWLKVTNVRIERLQDIDDSGILAEGLEIGCYFDDIWNSTIKKKDLEKYGWDANPWVWVIEFVRCEKPEKGRKGNE